VTGRRGLRYLVTGSRDWGDWALVRRFVDALPPGSTVIHGDARGADRMVERILTENKPTRARSIRVHGSDGTIGRRRGGARAGDVDIEVYPAEWDRYRPAEPGRGNPAGAIRNTRMLREGLPDRCVYFASDLSASPGTRNMVEQCTRAEVPVWAADEFIAYMRDGEPEEDGNEEEWGE
jgi:hypothetical protein